MLTCRDEPRTVRSVKQREDNTLSSSSIPPTQGKEDIFTAGVRAYFEESKLDHALINGVVDLLRIELGSRGLLNRPPLYVGLGEFRSWKEPGALTEFAMLAIEDVLVRRAESLYARTEVFSNLRGLFVLNIRRFVGMRQSLADPAGYNAYHNVRELLHTEATLRHVPDDIQAAMGAQGCAHVHLLPPSHQQGYDEAIGVPCEPYELQQHLSSDAAWSSTVELVAQSVGRKSKKRLYSVLVHATQAGLGTFRPRDLVALLAESGRVVIPDAFRRAMMVDDVHQKEAVLPDERPWTPNQAFEKWHDFAALERSLMTVINRHPLRRKKKEGVIRLLKLLVELVRQGEAIPSLHQLAALLEAPPSTVVGHIKTLRALAEPFRERAE